MDLNKIEKQLEEVIENKNNAIKSNWKSRIKELEDEVKNERKIREQFEEEVIEIKENFRKWANLLSKELDRKIEKSKEMFSDSQVQSKMAPKDEKCIKMTTKRKQ
jgi:hypothetical protein